jgi:hypothetical protein
MSTKGKAVATGTDSFPHLLASLRVESEMPKSKKERGVVQERVVWKTPLDLFNAMPYCQVSDLIYF